MEDLFRTDDLFLPPIELDESLYSWFARYHLLCSNGRSENTSRRLTGHPTTALQPVFPCGLDALSTRLPALGQPEDIIFQRTPFGLFARFLPKSRMDEVIIAMRSNRPMRIARALGLNASGLGMPAPLKACVQCIKEDLASRRIARWRTGHQLPGVLLCTRHKCQLQVVTQRTQLRAQEEFVLPNHLDTTDWRRTRPLGSTETALLQSLADWAGLLSAPSRAACEPFDPTLLRTVCHLQAKERGWLAIDGTLRFKQLKEGLMKSYGRLACIPTLEFIAEARKESGGFVGLLLREFDNYHHPLMHLVLLSFLFRSHQEFMETYATCQRLGAEGSSLSLTHERMSLRTSLAEMVGTEKISASEAACRLGITLRMALILLTEHEVEHRVCPRIVGTDRERHLVFALKRGDSPADIATALSVRKGYIKEYVASRPELRLVSEQARLKRRREWYRNRFLRVLVDNPSLPVKRIRREIDSGFEWLYRNDREWLEGVLPGIWHRPTP